MELTIHQEDGNKGYDGPYILLWAILRRTGTMNLTLRIGSWLLLLGATACLVSITSHLPAAPPDATAIGKESPVDPDKRVTLERARERAKLAGEIYAASLHMLHHHYFLREKSVVPARAMEDLFDQIRRDSHLSARWISVNAKAMSIDHEPQNEFEKNAARALAGGENAFELVEAGRYRVATSIPLRGGCMHCHGSFGGSESKIRHYAGLVIEIPTRSE